MLGTTKMIKYNILNTQSCGSFSQMAIQIEIRVRYNTIIINYLISIKKRLPIENYEST